MRLEGKRVAVTGAASGIGAAIAETCVAEGAHVIGIDLAPSPAASESRLADISDEAAVAAAFADLARLDGLVHSAGIAFRAPLADTEASDWDRVMRINLRGAFLAAKYALPSMRESGGSIVHLSSVVGITGLRNRSAYSTSKGGIVALTRATAMEVAKDRIRVNCLCPGFTQTPMTERLLEDPARNAALVALHPLGRLGKPEDIAQAALFLLSDESSWITGQALAVDGGFSAGFAADV